MPVVVDSSSIRDFEAFYKLFPQRAAQALSLAINDTIRNVLLPEARKEIYAEVNFPKGYLDQDDRLQATQFATPTRLVGVVRGRDRPTSLARFADGGGALPRLGRGGWVPVNGIQVKPGSLKKMRGAFLIPLRAGTTSGGNVGLAIKLRAGEKVSGVHTFDSPEIFPGVFLLYGPSVDQVFRGVAHDIEPVVMKSLETQFGRQFFRLGF